MGQSQPILMKPNRNCAIFGGNKRELPLLNLDSTQEKEDAQTSLTTFSCCYLPTNKTISPAMNSLRFLPATHPKHWESKKVIRSRAAEMHEKVSVLSCNDCQEKALPLFFFSFSFFLNGREGSS